ncbi:MAG: helix-turn-helix transcriptional regulator [Paludibacteraceae bacterium]|nr:helix-turn-helix transcriptional regulator [Paludibacteraceae bacterium]
MTPLAECVKRLRKQYGLTQEDLAYKSGVSLFSVRELEQGKMSMRMDKVNQILGLFNYELIPQRKDASQS